MRRLLALLVQVPLVLSVYGACSGGGDTGDAGDGAADVKAEKPPLDTGVVETGPTCTPSNVNASDLSWTPPRTPDPSACSDQQIADYFAACLTAPFTNCKTFTGATINKNCVTCLSSTEGKDTQFGPLIFVPNNVVYINTGGCIAIETGDVSATGCGAKVWEASQCEDLACSANCTGATFTDYQACTNAAATGTCAPEIAAQCDLSDAGTVVAACNLSKSSFKDRYPFISAVFCGGYPADAGPPSDGGTDASSDASSTDAAADADDGSADATTD